MTVAEGHEYDPDDPEDQRRLIAFMDQFPHWTDKDGNLVINKNYYDRLREDDE